MDDTLRCIRAWIDAGFTGAVCTPHAGPTTYVTNPGTIRVAVEELRGSLAKRGIRFTLWCGAEIRMTPEVNEWLRRVDVPTLGDGSHVLLDWWGTCWTKACDECIDSLRNRGFTPLLAHPERIRLDDAPFRRLIEVLEARGVLLQGNLGSLVGEDGPNAAERAWQFLREDRYAALASDTHHPAHVPSRVAALRAVATRLGPDRLRSLLEYRPREILSIPSVSCGGACHVDTAGSDR